MANFDVVYDIRRVEKLATVLLSLEVRENWPSTMVNQLRVVVGRTVGLPPQRLRIAPHTLGRLLLSTNNSLSFPYNLRYFSNDDAATFSYPEGFDCSKYTNEVVVRMPEIGEGEGKVLKWYKSEGEIVKYRDILCDIETPDFTYGMEIEDEELAIMGKILVEAPSRLIKENEPLCVLLHQSDKEEEIPNAVLREDEEDEEQEEDHEKDEELEIIDEAAKRKI